MKILQIFRVSLRSTALLGVRIVAGLMLKLVKNRRGAEPRIWVNFIKSRFGLGQYTWLLEAVKVAGVTTLMCSLQLRSGEIIVTHKALFNREIDGGCCFPLRRSSAMMLPVAESRILKLRRKLVGFEEIDAGTCYPRRAERECAIPSPVGWENSLSSATAKSRGPVLNLLIHRDRGS